MRRARNFQNCTPPFRLCGVHSIIQCWHLVSLTRLPALTIKSTFDTKAPIMLKPSICVAPGAVINSWTSRRSYKRFGSITLRQHSFPMGFWMNFTYRQGQFWLSKFLWLCKLRLTACKPMCLCGLPLTATGLNSWLLVCILDPSFANSVILGMWLTFSVPQSLHF